MRLSKGGARNTGTAAWLGRHLQSKRGRAQLLLLVGLAAFACFFRTPRAASGLLIRPDSTSYAVVAQRIATLGRFDIELNHVKYPAIYPPWFPLLLAPFYWLAPDNPGAGIWIIAVAGPALALAAFSITERLSTTVGGLLVAVTICVGGRLLAATNFLMSDIPSTALIVGALALVPAQGAADRAGRWLLIGTLLALAFGFRSTSGVAFAILVPALVHQRSGFGLWLVWLLLPLCIVVALTLAYNRAMFGNPLRTGYQFWAPWMFDYPGRIFSVRFALARIHRSARAPLYALAIGLVLWMAWILAQREVSQRWLLTVIALTSLSFIVVFLNYFFYENRFFFVPGTLAACVVSATVAHAVRRFGGAHELTLIALFLVLAAGARKGWQSNRFEPEDRQFLRACQGLEDNAVIVTRVDPLYFEPWVLRGTHREVVPADRGVEYANTRYAWQRAGELPDIVELLAQHEALGEQENREYEWAKAVPSARDAFAITAEDSASLAQAYAHRPIYVDRRILRLSLSPSVGSAPKASDTSLASAMLIRLNPFAESR